MSNTKPIKLFLSTLTGNVYASKAYKDLGEGRFLITGNKYDVTEEVKAIAEQMGYASAERAEELESLVRDMRRSLQAAYHVSKLDLPTPYDERMAALGLLEVDE